MANNMRTKTGGLLAAFILSIAAAIIIWQVNDTSAWAVPFIVLLCVGITLMLMSFTLPRTSKIGPSPSSYYMVNGTVITLIGGIGTLNLMTDLEWWYSLVIVLVVAAVLVLWVTFSSRD